MCWKVPPVALYQLAEVAVAAPSAGLSASLREVIAAGEALQISPRLGSFFASLPWCVLRNQYGPSETHVVTELALSWPPSMWPALPSIGRPIANVNCYLLDAHGQPVPLGVRGELYLGGVAASRGYLGRPDLTEERFSADPFVNDGTRMYRTGDVARWSAEGNLMFLGRADSQVKIRGFRVELGEIEAVLAESPALREAAVVIRGDGDKRLVAYVVPAAEGAALSATSLRSFLRERLPDYMVPSAFVVLDRLPLTASGKVDKRALPAPEKSALAHEGRVAPRQPIEEMLAGIFADVLHKSVDDVGAHDDFFAIGGHSLIATRAMARINAAFAIDLPLRALFEAKAVAGLARRVQAALGAGEAVTAEAIPPRSRALPLVLSFAQERLWFLAQLEPDNVSYNIPLAMRIGGPLDVEALGRAIAEIARRHEILRTTFAEAGGEPAPEIHAAASVPLPITSLASLSPGEREEAARRELAAETARPFDLARGPVLRARLIQLDVDDHVLSLTVHHIVSDGWGQGVLAREIAVLYGAFSAGAASPLPELSIQYADYAAWQRRLLQGEVLERQLAYWKGKLAGAPLALDLPADRPRPPVPTHRGAHHAFALPEGLEAALGELARREGMTLFMTLLAAFDVLLHRVSGQDDFLVGTAIAGRAQPETEPLIGIFVNTLVLRAQLSGEPTFRELLSRVKETCLGALAHQDMPFERLVQELDPDRDPSRSPLYQVSFALQNMPAPETSPGEVAWRRFGVEGASAKIDLALAMGTGSRGLMGAFEYSTDLFDAATIERMAARFRALLAGIVEEPEARIGALPILAEDEERRLVVEWNATERAYPRDAGLAALFEAQADRSPDAIAAAFDGNEITYRELDRRANRLGHHLRSRGVGPDVLVGLSTRRSMEMVIGMLGVIKAGGAYLPLDPDYPPERLAFMMEDARVPVVLAQADLAADLPRGEAEIVRLDAASGAFEAESDERPAGGAGGQNLAYAIYTSGSTGVPKGVCVPQRAVSRLVINSDYVVLGPTDRVAQASNASFDAATFEIWGALLNGARLVGIPKDVALSPRALSSALGAQGITAVFLTTALFNGVIREEPAAFRGVRHVLFGGEQVDPAVVRTALQQGPERLLHVYGPTETTTFATWHLVEAVAEDAATVPIGRPLANTRLYVLDQRLQPAPIGVPGELYIGGDGVARGYLNRPELTAERFVADPFAGEGTDSRLYRTGDLVRYLPNGEVVFLGRLDNQVKIRGFRIELGEIEAVLVTHPAVREAVVLAREAAGGKRLCAHVVPSGEARPSVAELKSFLAAKLPDYMVPAAFVTLDALPLNANGKVDRGALPAPEVEAPAEREPIEPRGPIEDALRAIFAEVLKLPDAAAVGARDGFFELGGHSLLAMQVIARVRATFGVELPLRALFEAPTPAGLGVHVQQALAADRGAAAPPLVRANREGPPALSFAQERLWFLAELDPGNASYVIPLAIRLEGALDRGALERSLDELVRRHEVLRTTFAKVDGRPVQVIHDRMQIGLPVWVAEGATPEERQEAAWRAIQAETRRPFDLATGPVLRARLFEVVADDHVLLLTMHHIAADGWSLGVLNREIAALYDAFVAGARSPLPELAIQYADYAIWQRGWLASAVLDEQLAYWRERLAGAPRSLDLPADRPRPPVRSARGARRSVPFSPEIGQAIAELARGEDATLFMTLLAAFDVLLYRYTGQGDIVVGTPIAGRTHAETEDLIGFFVNMLPLRVEVPADITFRALVARVKEVCLGAYAHQDLPFERLVQEISPERDLGRTPIFQVSFVVQSALTGAMALPGLARRWVAAETATAKLDLHVSLTESRGALVCGVEYATDLFDAATIERMVGHLGALLAAIAVDADRPLWQLPLLGEEEQKRLLVEWNDTTAPYPRDACLHHMFEAQADRTPDATAVIFERQRLTYRELDQRANRLANHLRALGVGPEVLVGLCLPRSAEMLVAILGVLKAGGAYVPMDPAYPAERIAFTIEDSRAPVLVTEKSVLPALPAHSARVVLIDGDAAQIAEASDARPSSGVGPNHLAYTLFTSGSTGRPKGVAIEHHSPVALVSWARTVYGMEEYRGTLFSTSVCFDLSIFEMFVPLSWGGAVIVARNALDLPSLPAKDQVTLINTVPSAMAELLRMEGVPANLRTVNLAGEPLVHALARRIYAVPTIKRLLNLYGPTEDTTYSTFAEGRPETGLAPQIGRPIANTTLYVLDAAMQPVPIGVPGELYIGGEGLARGYLNRPELTAERFVPHPFSVEPGEKLYRTGDLVRYLPNGEVVFLGRLDDQVKIRGFRIELGEIEAALGKHPQIRDAAVLAREDRPGEKRLVAYVVPRGEEAPAAEDLMSFLRATLPDYLVPRAIVTLAALPLNANGKVDRRALPAPEFGSDDAAYVEPRTPTEQKLAAIWREVLEIDRVGAHDNFFLLGGHSLLATRVTARVLGTLGVDVALARVFEAPTLAGLAAVIDAMLWAEGAPPPASAADDVEEGAL